MSKHSFMSRLLKQMEDPNAFSENNADISNIVDEVLFLGSVYATDETMLEEKHIKHVISIGFRPICNTVEGIQFYSFSEIKDSGDTINVDHFFNIAMPEIHQIINNCVLNKEPVLVHCHAGISRSASVVITWLMKHRNMTYEEAYIYVKERRPTIVPNQTFSDIMKKLNLH